MRRSSALKRCACVFTLLSVKRCKKYAVQLFSTFSGTKKQDVSQSSCKNTLLIISHSLEVCLHEVLVLNITIEKLCY
jgi:hypothetical protein